MAAQVIPMWNAAHSRVREDDGVVVFALPAARVRVDDWGCSCPLWVPGAHTANVVAEADLQRLRHCRVALRQGMAEGFVLQAGEQPGGQPEILSLRVIKTGQEYWARWGCGARAGSRGEQIRSAEVRI
jgi:hypothetical protein